MNQKTLEAMSACSASFLRFNFDAFTCYTAAKLFVDAYEREKHEQRRAVPDPAQRALPPDWSDDKQKAYHQLASAVFEGGDFVKIQAAAKSFVEICKREGRHKSQADTTGWSYAKSTAYERLQLLCNEKDNWSHNQNVICNAARRLAAACEREELEYPKNGEVYRDIFGNRYVVISVHGSFSDVESGSNPFVALMKMGTTALVTVGLKDFFYPTFKKE